MAEDNTKPVDTSSFLEDVPTRFEGGQTVMGVPLPKIVTEPFKEQPTIPAPDFLEDARPSAMERVKEVGTGAVQGAARDTPVVAGAVAGLRLGMPMAAAAAPVISPLFAAAIPLATTAFGAGAGYLFGQELDRWFPAVPREDLVPYREGGKTFGSSIASAPAAFGLPVMTGNRVSRFLSAYGEAARRNPATFMATEGITAGSMGVAGGGAESYLPGNTGARLGAELAAGIFTPSRLLLSGVDLAFQGLQAAKGAIAGNASRSETRAADILANVLEKNKEDPAALIAALRAQLPPGVLPSSAQKSGSQTLMDLETSLGKSSAEFGGQIGRQGTAAMDAYELLIENLQRIGNPESLRIAAQLRENKFQAVLDGRLAKADADAAAKIARITKDTPDARRQIGSIVKADTEMALREARTIESELWTAAINELTKPTSKTVRSVIDVGWDRFRNVPVRRTVDETRLVTPSLRPSSTIQTFMDRAANVGEALYDEAVPSAVRKIMDAFGVDQATVQRYKAGRNTQEFVDTGAIPASFMPKGKDVPINELVNYRSELLKMAREAAGKGDINNAEFYSRIAEGMLSDLSSVKNPLFDAARSFSKSLNDVFTRTFAKTASETGDMTKAGAERVPAEILVMRAFGNNADVTIQRMEQVEDAVKFMRTQYDDAVAKYGKNSTYAKYLKPMAEMANDKVASIQDAQNRVLRLLAGEAIETTYDQAKGAYVQKLNTAKLTRFAQQFSPMLEKLGIMGDLRDATHAQNLLLQVRKENNVMANTIRDQTAFAKVLSSENPTQVIGDVLNSNFPVKNLTRIVQLAQASGPDAVNGLKSAVLDYAYTKAGGMADRFSVSAYNSALFEPLARNQPSIVNLLRSSGAMTASEMQNLKRLIDPMVRVETALKNGIPMENLIQGADAVTDLALRSLGSTIGQAAGGSNNLIAMSAGSKAVRQIFDALPNASVRQVLEKASKDPEMMALLLEKGKTSKQQVSIYNRLLDKLGEMGFAVGRSAVTPALNYVSPEEPRPQQLQQSPQPAVTPQGQAARQLRMLPPAPNTRGVPGMGKQSSAAPQSGGGAPTSDSRAMFQQLFPFDSIGAMASQQGQQPAQPAQG